MTDVLIIMIIFLFTVYFIVYSCVTIIQKCFFGTLPSELTTISINDETINDETINDETINDDDGLPSYNEIIKN